ncbi:MAG: kelch repeat-containing protein [Gemmataceae bacterium]
MRRLPLTLIVFLLAWDSPAAEPAANVFARLEQAPIVGRRWDIPLGYAADLDRFLVLGGRSSFADYRKPRSYDVLALERGAGRWENWFPKDKNWGPKFGPCMAPPWKNEVWMFQDSEGNVRPNWTVYGTFSLGQKYDYAPDSKAFYFFAKGKTFRYDPARREWTDLAPETDPERTLKGNLLWSSMCYDQHNKQFVLFGGGNIESARGDPGTWTYTPSSNKWEQLELDVQPPARANARLCYDPVHKKIVLFGGDRLDQLFADTWTFDVVKKKWEEQKPARGPGPRAGHALVWLPRAKKALLLGGYGYTSGTGYVERLYRPLPFEAWVYDAGSNRWDLLLHTDLGKTAPQSEANFFTSAAADKNDNALVLADNGTWLAPIDAAKIDEAGTEKYSVKPGTVERRTGAHDPAWYQDVPAADPDKVKAELARLPANEWVLRPTPRLARPNMDWGSAVYAPDLDLILRFSGGHSAYSGTAPHVYDVKTDRYSIPFAPEYPIEYVYSNDQVNGEWSFQGNPWMTGHTYKSTGYDPNLKSLVFAPHTYTYFFDPKTGRWTRAPERNPYRPNFYNVTVCATPQGAVVWADGPKGAGLWRLDAKTRTWRTLPLEGRLPDKSPDRHGLAYDSKRDRLLFFSDAGKDAGNVVAYDFKTGVATPLEPAGKSKGAVHSRETIYLPEEDKVLVGARVADDKDQQLWLLYDCARNAWLGVELPGADPIGKGTVGKSFNNSMGLMYDPGRRLIWAVGQNSHVHVLRLDLAKARTVELK